MFEVVCLQILGITMEGDCCCIQVLCLGLQVASGWLLQEQDGGLDEPLARSCCQALPTFLKHMRLIQKVLLQLFGPQTSCRRQNLKPASSYRRHVIDVSGAHHGPADCRSPLLWQNGEELGRLAAIEENMRERRNAQHHGKGQREGGWAQISQEESYHTWWRQSSGPVLTGSSTREGNLWLVGQSWPSRLPCLTHDLSKPRPPAPKAPNNPREEAEERRSQHLPIHGLLDLLLTQFNEFRRLHASGDRGEAPRRDQTTGERSEGVVKGQAKFDQPSPSHE